MKTFKPNYSRWFLVHWILYHSILIVLLFMASILLFIIPRDLFKLIGLAPLVLAFVMIFLTTKVYNLFLEMRRDQRCPPLAGADPGPRPYLITEDMKYFQSGHEFYPLDLVSRALDQRMALHSYLPQPDDQDSEASLVSRKNQYFEMNYYGL